MDNDSVKIVRLQSGEDIIAGYTTYEDTVMLDNPMHIIFKRSTEGTVMLMLPWLPIELIKSNIATISEKDILTIVEPKDALVEYYSNTITHSKIAKMMNDEKLIQNLKSAFNVFDTDNIPESDEVYDEMEDMELTEDDVLQLLEDSKKSTLH